MNQTTEIQKLLNNAVHPSLIKPDVSRYIQITEYLNVHPNLSKEFIGFVKLKMTTDKNARTQILIFELIEFTSCRCQPPIINEFNSKSFLQILNLIFNQVNLPVEVSQKALQLVQFWHFYFEQKQDLYPNFSWYYSIIAKKGIEFPIYIPSSYIKTRNEMTSPTQTKNDYQSKLIRDLTVVAENVALGNQLIDEKNTGAVVDVIFNIRVMGKKLEGLLRVLQNSNEQYLESLVLALRSDIIQTGNRYQKFTAKQKVADYNSEWEQTLKLEIKKQDNQFQNTEFKDFTDQEFGVFSENQKQTRVKKEQSNWKSNQLPANKSSNLYSDKDVEWAFPSTISSNRVSISQNNDLFDVFNAFPEIKTNESFEKKEDSIFLSPKETKNSLISTGNRQLISENAFSVDLLGIEINSAQKSNGTNFQNTEWGNFEFFDAKKLQNLIMDDKKNKILIEYSKKDNRYSEIEKQEYDPFFNIPVEPILKSGNINEKKAQKMNSILFKKSQ